VGGERADVRDDVHKSRRIWVMTADVDGDGKTDLVIVNPGSGTVSVLLSNGNVTFVAPVDYPAGEGVSAAVALDLNSDGRADVATANLNAGTVSVLLNACLP
jgi:FG-GAP-like repeat